MWWHSFYSDFTLHPPVHALMIIALYWSTTIGRSSQGGRKKLFNSKRVTQQHIFPNGLTHGIPVFFENKIPTRSGISIPKPSLSLNNRLWRVLAMACLFTNSLHSLRYESCGLLRLRLFHAGSAHAAFSIDFSEFPKRRLLRAVLSIIQSRGCRGYWGSSL